MPTNIINIMALKIFDIFLTNSITYFLSKYNHKNATMTIINVIKARIRIDIAKKYAELNMNSTSLRIKFLNFSDLKHQITIAIKQQNLINVIHIKPF